jgi:hypothetical protein
MGFFMYNFDDPRSQMLHARGRLFIEEIKKQVRARLWGLCPR